ncbi:Proton-dependent oligopeptide transporter family [Dillenia turbinata]|uniref:Proton-dependent oligopeptide transporter family n=1 Tax=Dillenia turbinata TaxID=194707 RepID=A0AAN8UQS3_9MAGN
MATPISLLTKASSLSPPYLPLSSSKLSTMGEEEAPYPESKDLKSWGKGKGGFRACTFIYVLAAFDNMGFIANMVSMVLYFLYVMHFGPDGASNTLTNFMGSTFLLSIIGGFISDTYLSRISTCLIFGTLEVMALAMITIQARLDKLHPQYCGSKSSCIEGGKALMLYTSLCLLALGTGGVRGVLPSLGADQFNPKDPKEAKALASYFNYLLLSTTLGGAVGVTAIVWISMNKGWWKGFLISTVFTAVGFVVLGFGKPFYRGRAPGDSPLVRIIQVVIVAFKNRSLPKPENPEELYELDDKVLPSVHKISHTDQFSFFDRAAILPKESEPQQWKVCTVTQVEEFKVLVRMMPILFSTIIMNTCLAQLQTFSVQQGAMMDLHLGSIKVEAPMVPVIPLVFMAILIPIYDFFFVPFARKITHHPSGITQLQRVGVGLVLSVISMAVAAIVEVKRRNRFHKDPAHPISLFWLSFQYGIFGIADMFTLVGLLEFFYKEAPAGMRSLSTSFTWLSLSFGYFLSSIFVDIINSITKRVTPSKKGWLQGETLNQSKLDLFYWFLSILSCLNFLNYLLCANWYKYKSTDQEHELKRNVAKEEALPPVEESAKEVETTKTVEVEASSAVEAQQAAGETTTDAAEKQQQGPEEK